MNAGIYIHIPFCIRKCPYCDFYSSADLSLVSAFADALIDEIRMAASGGDYAGAAFDSIYIGGGTPTVMDTRSIARIMAAVSNAFVMLPGVEITIEANPATLSARQLTDLRGIGFNRINIGLQSFDDANLDFLGRLHNGHDAVSAVYMAEKSGFENIGIDLMYGLPEQAPENWQKDLETAVSLSPAHISCYMLTFEPGTAMDNARKSGRFKIPGDEAQSNLFRMADQVLTRKGYDHYEISNFARDTHLRSRHNTGYWNNRPYLGLGPAAHSYAPPVRKANVRSVRRYIGRMEAGKSPVESTETLDLQQQIMEAIYLGLRQADGICSADFNTRFQADFFAIFSDVIGRFVKEGYLAADSRGCRPTLSGMLMQESLAAAFIAAL